MGRLDFESVRHRIKLVRDTGGERLFENRDDVTCPVCGDVFEEALATTDRTCRLTPSERIDVCLVRENDRVVAFTHTRQ